MPLREDIESDQLARGKASSRRRIARCLMSSSLSSIEVKFAPQNGRQDGTWTRQHLGEAGNSARLPHGPIG